MCPSTPAILVHACAAVQRAKGPGKGEYISEGGVINEYTQPHHWSHRSETGVPITMMHDDKSSTNEGSASPRNHLVVWMVQIYELMYCMVYLHFKHYCLFAPLLPPVHCAVCAGHQNTTQIRIIKIRKIPNGQSAACAGCCAIMKIGP